MPRGTNRKEAGPLGPHGLAGPQAPPKLPLHSTASFRRCKVREHENMGTWEHGNMALSLRCSQDVQRLPLISKTHRHPGSLFDLFK